MMADLKYEVVEKILSVNDGSSDWDLELNLISWNGKEPKYDLRKWSQDGTKMSKGLTMTEDEAILLFQKSDEFLDRFREKKESATDESYNFPFD